MNSENIYQQVNLLISLYAKKHISEYITIDNQTWKIVDYQSVAKNLNCMFPHEITGNRCNHAIKNIFFIRNEEGKILTVGKNCLEKVLKNKISSTQINKLNNISRGKEVEISHRYKSAILPYTSEQITKIRNECITIEGILKLIPSKSIPRGLEQFFYYLDLIKTGDLPNYLWFDIEVSNKELFYWLKRIDQFKELNEKKNEVNLYLKKFELGNIVRMKRPHACQKNCWKIVRVGADIKIKCINCNHIVMMSRKKFIENLEYVVE